jgi:hypothetical protein
MVLELSWGQTPYMRWRKEVAYIHYLFRSQLLIIYTFFLRCSSSIIASCIVSKIASCIVSKTEIRYNRLVDLEEATNL